MKPLAVVATHPIQNQAPFYRYLASQGWPIHVFYLCDRGVANRWDPDFGREVVWDTNLLEGYSHEFLPNLRREGIPERFFGLANPSLTYRLTSRDFFGVWVHGYRNLSTLSALAVSAVKRLPIFYRSESTLLEGPPSGIKLRLGKLLSRTVSACLTAGTENRRFYQYLGIPEERLFLVPYAVDNEHFSKKANTPKEKARSLLGLPRNGPLVLFAGKLIARKQPDLLLRAFVSSAPPQAHLAFVGDGEMRSQLELAASRLPTGRVSFLGFLNQQEIGLAYSSTDLFVLPSQHETWGLVVNEVMNFGVPVVASNRVGSGPDLVEEIFKHDDEAALARLLGTLLSDQVRLQEMGRAARTRIQRWSFHEADLGLRKAVNYVGWMREGSSFAQIPSPNP